ncbi:MAG: S9 family peptidase [Thermoanaerobaculales bacterium]|jgi:dipeptidyl aminopeptidase/acylaminoacyl peptidase|nr:S9 family peptidase [Thermoanaerobaculales bacterium]
MTTCRSLVVLVLVLAAASIAAAESHPFNVHDLVAMQRISDPQPSPNGAEVVFVVKTMDLESNSGDNDLWLAAVDGSATRRLTAHTASDWSPRWADDRTVYFLSTRSGSVQVWRIAIDGGEAEQVTDLPLDIEAFQVGPGAAALYLALKVFPDCEDPVPCTVSRLAAEAERESTGLVYDQTFVRHWDFWKDGRRNHIFRLPIGEGGRPSGAPKDLMPGIDGDSPTIPWGGDGDWTVAPDDSTLVYTAKVVNGSEETWSTDYDLWVVPTDGSAAPEKLTTGNRAWDASPAFSPDGSTLAYLAMSRPGYEADRFRVVVMSWPDGDPQVLTEGWDRSPRGIVWSPDGAWLYASADNIGNHSIFRIDPASGRVQALLTRHTNSSPGPLPDGGLVFARDSLTSPVELFVRPADGGEVRRITDLNGDRLAGIDFGSYSQFSFTGAHGDEVFGYFIEPVGRQPGKKYPLAFLIHGGPQGSFDDHFHYRWNPQIYAGAGYATVMIDFHGSTGYGQAFTDAINGDWGGAPYEDLMKGLDDVLRRHTWIDPDRVAAAGASFGGYMINWIQGMTDRFAALVCHDGNLDELMAYYDTEELWFPEWEHGGTPWENPEGYTKHSPIQHVGRWQTPQLVIHGALDYRVVDTQGIATFNALQRRGVPSRLLYYPDENHWVLKPANSIQWHEVVLEWMGRWTAAESAE